MEWRGLFTSMVAETKGKGAIRSRENPGQQRQHPEPRNKVYIGAIVTTYYRAKIAYRRGRQVIRCKNDDTIHDTRLPLEKGNAQMNPA
jgi:hypothetical protein